MIQKLYSIIILSMIFTAPMLGQITITDADLGDATYTWTADNEYLLDGYVFLEEGGVLNIEPGTVIRGKEIPSSTDVASALIITRGATINAEGTARQPIIFTAESDDLNDPADLSSSDRGLWGGLIVLGRATITDETTEVRIEGVATADPNDPRLFYGAASAGEFMDDDNSGTLRYVSVRHGGSKLEDGDEINGITLGAVGSETTIEYVEVYANDDDGIEWFGGTVGVKFAAVGFCKDDSFDWDTGFTGKGQFWLSIHGADAAGNGGELDGSKPDDNSPVSNPVVFNATFIGAGVDNLASGQDNDHALLFRDNSAGNYWNSVFTDFTGFAIQVEDVTGTPDSYFQLQEGNLTLRNNVWFGFGEGSELNGGANGIINITGGADDADASDLIDHLVTFENTLEDPMLTNISRNQDNSFDPRPMGGSPVFNNLADLPGDDFFTDVNFKGAFGATLWVRGWTALDQAGHLPEATEIVITDDDLQGGQDYEWTSDNVYVLDGYVFLEEGGTLTIQEGTVIKGQEIPSSTDVASALIVTRGAQIFANGTADNPIIMTAETDDLADATDLGCDDRGLWGGLIILGRASVTDETTEVRIEGVATADPNDPRVFYGAPSADQFDDEDNSGTLRYVSVRHAGSKLEDGDEINGITFGAVGSGTTVEYVEVFANDDDGIEWFGGTVNVKYALVACCKDDSFDWDTGFRGKGQFWASLHGADAAGNGGELDGSKPDDNSPVSNPVVFNATFIGAGKDNLASGQDNDHALLFRDNSAGNYWNSIFTDFTGFAIQVEDVSGTPDSYAQLQDGNLTLRNNIWWEFGEGSELNGGTNGIINITGGADDADASDLIDHLAGNGNSLEDPQLGGISRDTDGGFDPRPNESGPAYQNLAPNSDDEFFTPVSYKGAFCAEGVWINGWTAVSEYGILGNDIPNSAPDCDIDFAPECVNEVVITDADLVGGTTYNWTNDNCYILDGYVFLEEGGVLNIEAGTIIKGREVPSSTDVASALIITRGAQIFANGTKDQPIIMTAEDDDVSDPTDLGCSDRGFWGGLIVLGRATITDETTEVRIEGVATADPNDPRLFYGAANAGMFMDDDNSGVIRYLSVRHGGSKLEDGDEINGITLGAVGSGTTIEYVEVFANDDDGIEWFGGTVNVKYAAVACCKDDSFDWDTGFRGFGQFWLSLHGADAAGNGGELDGSKPDDNSPVSNPVVFNATFIGAGVDNIASGQDNDHALLFRDNSAGNYWNSIFTDFTGFAIQVEDVTGTPDSYSQLQDGNLTLRNNIWWEFGEGSELNGGTNGIINITGGADDADASDLIDHLAGNGNSLEDPLLGGISRDTDGGFDPRPDGSGPAYMNLAPSGDDDFFSSVSYKGAFCNDGVWIKGWTAISEYGILDNAIPESAPDCDIDFAPECTNEVVITDADLVGGTTYNWTNDNCYILDGYVFLEEGGVLNIEAGTVIKGREVPSSTDVASALIITRGAQIFANGTKAQPIIMTAEDDDVSDPTDLGCSDRGFWGGLIILGRATITDETTEVRIEGVATADPNDPRVFYGAASADQFMDDDNSGELRYVSVRHGGSKLEDGDEINGITLGAVGSGTTIEYVEVFANDDDGIEWFGGTVDVKYAAVVCCKDDSFDWDTGFRGRGQFWFSLHGADAAGNGGELDGSKPDDNSPVSNPVVFNATFIGAGIDNIASGQDNDHALLFRDNSAGNYWNSIFTDFTGFAIQVEDIAGTPDSYSQLQDGNLTLRNNIWWEFGEGSELNGGANGIINITGDADDTDASDLIDHLATNGNTLEDPQINGIGRTTNGDLDPRTNADGPAYTGLANFPVDDFFMPVGFKGAFCSEGTWLEGWTATFEYGILDNSVPSSGEDCEEVVNIEDVTADKGYVLEQNMPNPAKNTTIIKFSLPTTTNISLVVYNVDGREVARIIDNERRFEGENMVEFNTSRLATGIYYYTLTNREVTLTRSLAVKN